MYWRVIQVLWLRELIRFWREKSRVITSLIQPLLWLVVMGQGIGGMFGPGGSSRYMEFVFPGVIGMTVLFTAANSGLSIVWDKEFGFMREILVAPVARGAVVIGKTLAGSTTALFQGMVIMVLAPLVGIHLTWGVGIKILGAMLLMALCLSTLGVILGVTIDSFHSYPMINNFIMIPMFFLSGAVFPLKSAPSWMQKAAMVNPAAYGMDLLRAAMLGQSTYPAAHSIVMLLAVSLLFGWGAVYLLKRTP